MSVLNTESTRLTTHRAGASRPSAGFGGCVRTILLALLFLVECPVTQAQAAQASLKLGYVDLLKVFEGYQHKQESEQVLEQRGKQKQTELEGRFNDLKKMRQSLELLNDQAKDAKAREIEERADEFKRVKERTERDLLRERSELAKQILDEIDQAVADYAKANGYSVILDQRSLLYGEEIYDVTADILKSLNARYAAKTGKH